MTTTRRRRPDPTRYELRVDGHLHERWVRWFEGFAIGHDDDGTTTLSGPVADQAALHGLLNKVRDLGMTLLSVSVVEDRPGAAPQSTTPPERGRRP